MAANSESDPSGNKTSPHYGDYDLWVVRFDALGNILWEKTFGGSRAEGNAFIIPASGGGFFLAGSSVSGADGNKTSPFTGANSIWLVRLDSDGNKIWDRSYGKRGEAFVSFAPTTDGGLILDSYYFAYPDELGFGSADIWILRLDAAGNELWSHDFGGSGLDIAFDIHQTKDGGFIFDAESSSPPSGNKTSPLYGGADVWVVRLDANGNKSWENSYGGTNRDSPGNIQETPTGDFIVAAMSASPPGGNKSSPLIGQSDSWLLRLDSGGNKISEHTYGGNGQNYMGGLLQMKSGGVLLFGASGSHGGARSGPYFGNLDYWMLRLDADGRKLWDMSLGGSEWDMGFNLQPTLDGGFLFSGYSFSPADGNKTSPSYGGEDFWVIKLSPEQVCDADGDGVPDDLDLCPDSPAGAIVDAHGCSVEQLAPCDAPWKNHEQYVKAVKETAHQFFKSGRITHQQQEAIVKQAEKSDCGKKEHHPAHSSSPPEKKAHSAPPH